MTPTNERCVAIDDGELGECALRVTFERWSPDCGGQVARADIGIRGLCHSSISKPRRRSEITLSDPELRLREIDARRGAATTTRPSAVALSGVRSHLWVG